MVASRQAPRRTRSRVYIDVPETRPLLPRRMHSHEPEAGPLYSCAVNSPSQLPVYTNIHRIRRDIISVVEDYLSLDQLRDVRINVSVVRPLVDKLYDLDDISIVYCLLVNRVQFLHEQTHLNNRQNVNFSRATLCELVATRVLRRFREDNEGTEGLLVLAHILIAGFEPFQGAPEEVRRAASLEQSTLYHRTLPALEVAILCESKLFLSSTSCQIVVDAVYDGRVTYTPSSMLDIIPDRYKKKPISLYDPREASLLNQYRLIVPRTRNFLELVQFATLLGTYLFFMTERDASRISISELVFAVYAFGWVLDQIATMLEHGWQVYTQNLWSFLDVTFSLLYTAYLLLRVHAWRTESQQLGQQALDVLAMGAPVLVPRIAFVVLSDNLLFVCLRAMMADFALLTALAAWCFLGFLLSLLWLGEGAHPTVTISKWMIYIWFGLDGTGIQRSAEFHWLLGPGLMVTFAFLGNTLFLTILVSMLSNTFGTIVSNATAEIQYRHAVLTLEGVKSDAIFAYQPPFNILALVVLVPLKFLVSPRWFHKIHVASVRTLNLPLLLLIAAMERRMLWPGAARGGGPHPGAGAAAGSGSGAPPQRGKQWYRGWWRITSHSDIYGVFDLPPPDSVEEQIAVDDELTRHLIRRQYTRRDTLLGEPAGARHHHHHRHTGGGGGSGEPVDRPAESSASASDSQTLKGSSGVGAGGSDGVRTPKGHKAPSRRDSMALPALAEELRGVLGESGEVGGMAGRLEALEAGMQRMERMLRRVLGDAADDDDDEDDEDDDEASPAVRGAESEVEQDLVGADGEIEGSGPRGA